uniref:annexin A4-like n=1 Tax=Styela clava TaxID=7725 RepID=UPI00193A09FB|nr:annexin A4-like [Styela clava]
MSEVSQTPKYSGTVKAYKSFHPDRDAQVFVDNLRHIGGDETAIISVVSSRTLDQRLEIARRYEEQQEKPLLADLKLYTRLDFQRVLLACFTPAIQYDSWSLNEALEEFGTDEKSLVEILISRSNSQIKEIREYYQKMYDHEVDALIKRKTSGEFCDMLLMLATPSRDESNTVSTQLARRDAKVLFKNIPKSCATRNYSFNEVFCKRNFQHLRATFEEYRRLSGRDILQDIRTEFHGHMKDGLKAITEYARSPPEYFAHRLYRSMKGLGTEDSTLTRIIVTRSEIDMTQIKEKFNEKYGETLEQFIMGDTSFAYRTILLSLIF